MTPREIELIEEFLIEFCKHRKIKANIKFSAVTGYSADIREIPNV